MPDEVDHLPPAARPGTLLGDPASVIAPGAIREVAASRRRARPGYDDDGSGGCRGHGAARHAVGVRGLHVLWELWEPRALMLWRRSASRGNILSDHSTCSSVPEPFLALNRNALSKQLRC